MDQSSDDFYFPNGQRKYVPSEADRIKRLEERVAKLQLLEERVAELEAVVKRLKDYTTVAVA